MDSVMQYVESVDLSGVPTYGRTYLGPPPPRFVPDDKKDQAAVIGSSIQSFPKGLDKNTRLEIQNALLLAELRAKKLASPSDIDAWYTAYFDALTSLGWVTRQRGLVSFETHGSTVEVNKAVLSVAASLLGGAATTAYQVVAAAIGALQKLDENSSELVIFQRNVTPQDASFQVGIAGLDGSGFLKEWLMAFQLHAKEISTRVLFFNLKSKEATFKRFAGQLDINKDALDLVADKLAARVAEYVDGYVRTLDI